MTSSRLIILDPSFEGDENDLLRRLQEELFDGLCWEIFASCRTAYMRAEEVLGVRTDLSRKLQTQNVVSYEMLGLVYRHVAEDMRKSMPHLIQPLLPFRGEDHTETLRQEWISYFYSEVRNLAQQLLFARAVVTAACWPENPEGGAAMQVLDGALTLYYRRPGWEDVGAAELLEPSRRIV